MKLISDDPFEEEIERTWKDRTPVCLGHHRRGGEEEASSDERDRRVVRRVLVGQLSLPPVNSTASLLVVARLSREGIYWHHHAPHEVVRLSATLEDESLEARSVPNRWHEQAGGWSWVLFEMSLGKSQLRRQVSLEVETRLPALVDVELRTWLFPEA